MSLIKYQTKFNYITNQQKHHNHSSIAVVTEDSDRYYKANMYNEIKIKQT